MSITKFLLRKVLWKGFRRVIQVLVSAAASERIQSFGVNVDTVQSTAVLTGLLEAGLNTVKVKYPKLFGWL